MASSSKLNVGDRSYEIFRLAELQASYDVARLPYTLRVLLENVLRNGDEADVEAVARWDAKAEPSNEISFAPSRVLLQDLTGVPAVVDLAAMRNAMADLGGDPERINPLIPAELVIDHSVQVDAFAERLAFETNVELEFERNHERYLFLRWGQTAFSGFKVVPPGTGICHQVNLEYLARVVEDRDGVAFPDTLVGTDSHTTMVNGLGVLGWGVGGIEAEAAMLGQPLSMLVPQVVGFKLSGSLPEGATATDLVLTVTEILRKTGVVGKFVEYFGEGVTSLPLADRATIGNMSPEYGATCGFFPVDEVTLDYLRLTGRPAERIALVEAYCKENMLWHDPNDHATYSQVVELDLGDVEPSIAGPRRPQDRVPLARAKTAFVETLDSFGVAYGNGDEAVADTFPASDPTTEQQPGGEVLTDTAGVATAEHVEPHHSDVAGTDYDLDHGSVVIAAITSCTNTSNPQVMVAAGPARAERRREGHLAQAVGQVVARAGLEGRHALLRAGRPRRAARRARLQHRRLRLHDVHRQLGAARRRDLGGDHRRRPRRLLGALGQPQLRGAHPSRGEGELPRLAAARRRLRARRAHGHRLRDRADRGRRLPARHLAEREGGERHDRHLGARRALLRDVRRRLHRRRRVARAAGSGGRAVRVAGRLHVCPPSAVLRGDGARARHGLGRRGRALPRLARRLGDDRPHLARRLDPPRLAGREVPHRSRRRAQGLQLVRRASRQPRGDGARHVRERAAAQQARARVGGNVDGARARRARR